MNRDFSNNFIFIMYYLKDCRPSVDISDNIIRHPCTSTKVISNHAHKEKAA